MKALLNYKTSKQDKSKVFVKGFPASCWNFSVLVFVYWNQFLTLYTLVEKGIEVRINLYFLFFTLLSYHL